MTDAQTHSPHTSTENGASETPRLKPIEKPSSWKTRIAYALARWQMGTVITPMKVTWARVPEGLRLANEMIKLERQLSLDSDIHLLVKTFVATINGCTFCQDIALAEAPGEELPSEKLRELLEYDTSSAFTDAERAALAYAEEVTNEIEVADETFDALQSHFNEREIVEITWLVSRENYYNRMNRALGIGSDNLCDLTTDLLS